MNVEDAEKFAEQALKTFQPGTKFNLIPLKSVHKSYDTWVFRCKVKGENKSYICKLGARDLSGRRKLKNQYEKLIEAQKLLGDVQFSTPVPYAFLEQECALFMEDCKGSSLKSLLPRLSNISEAAPYMEKAGRWIADFQAPTSQATVFDPTPHLNWLRKKLLKGEQGALIIPEKVLFKKHFTQLENLAEKAHGLPSRNCVTHRDFHLGNLVFKNNGATYGIDFENSKDDTALRDIISFLFDFVISWDRTHLDGAAGLNPAPRAFRAGYADTDTADQVFSWFQKFSALKTWSNLGDQSAFSPNRAHKFQWLQKFVDDPHILLQ
ncbi:MAG: aminoglycoside phosphotransferase (APT) family kinase protein [Halocynthiibacter sp.]|jgi:aminoglycoside phosphotransferase (APT) family kinase protein